jgi:divalent anion:Na+ symporter, DASS family
VLREQLNGAKAMLIAEQTFGTFDTIRDSVYRGLPSLKTPLAIVLAFAVGWVISNIPTPAASLNANGAQFLVTLAIGVVLWVSNVFDEYVVAFMLLASWVLLEIVPAKVALEGFSHESWFFVVAALGMGAAVAKSGLLQRIAAQILRRIPITAYKSHTFLLFASGLIFTPMLPTGKARVVLALPFSHAIAEATGFPKRSNGSAALALSATIGFSQMSFVFLTGAESCLLGWNLLPETVKSEFGWVTWLSPLYRLRLSCFFLCSVQFT